MSRSTSERPATRSQSSASTGAVTRTSAFPRERRRATRDSLGGATPRMSGRQSNCDWAAYNTDGGGLSCTHNVHP